MLADCQGRRTLPPFRHCLSRLWKCSWKYILGESPEQQWRLEINVFGQILKFFVFIPSRLSAWWKRSRETGCAPVPLSECLRSPRPHKCAPSATAALTAPSQSGSPQPMEKQIHMKEGLFALCSLLLLLAESWGFTVETNLIIRSAANAHNFIYIDLGSPPLLPLSSSKILMSHTWKAFPRRVCKASGLSLLKTHCSCPKIWAADTLDMCSEQLASKISRGAKQAADAGQMRNIDQNMVWRVVFTNQ